MIRKENRFVPKLILIAFASMTLASSQAAAGLQADLIFLNAIVRTMDSNQPLAEAVAVYGNRIAAVGTHLEIAPFAGAKTRVIDARGRLLLPGFNDSHTHFLDGGHSLSNLDLRDAISPDEMAQRLAAYVRGIPAGQWIVGGNWDHEKWPGTPLPTKEMIDAATPSHPVFLSRTDGHMSLANSLAMKLSGITNQTKDPEGGVIVRDHGGTPTGVFKDAAQNLIKVSPRSDAEKLASARAATDHAAKLGVTSVTDMSAGEDVGIYQRMDGAGQLKTRIYAIRSIVSWRALAETGVRAGFGSGMIRIGGLKGFADGSLGSSTALFFEPFDDAPNTRGLLFNQMLPEGTMNARALGADKAGLQVMIHAIGDEANFRILNLYEEVVAKNGERDRRFRIEHAQHLRASEIPRFGKQQVIASMQPYHAADDGRWCDRRIGPVRSKGTYAFRSLLDSGATLAFGTDWDVAPLNPLVSIKAAVTRQTLDGKHPSGWVPEQKISVQEAVHAYTMGSAYAEFEEGRKGSITAGKFADLVLIDRDIFKTDPAEIENARVLLTVVGGRVVYESEH